MPVKAVSLDALARFETLVWGVFQDTLPASGLPALDEKFKHMKALGDLKGKADELHVLYPGDNLPRRVILCGLGDKSKYHPEACRKAVGRVVKKAKSLKAKELTLVLESFQGDGMSVAETARAAALATVLASYRFQEFTRVEEEKGVLAKINLACQRPLDAAGPARQGEIIAESANFTRTLANRPGNQLFPQALADEAKSLAKESAKISVKVLQKPELEREGFGALLAVGSGSQKPPVLIEIKYRGASAGHETVALVGKGITFDSGGICLKPAAKMEDMRYDMSGAAAVLGIVRAAARLNLPVNLVGVIPAAENMPSGSATRPGDIVKSLSGQFIEILNTDAEGRLILADGLAYALRHKPSCIIDIATLTGAVSVALGNLAIGLMSNQDDLAREMQAAAERSGERVWRLPLWEEYQELIKSENADMANISSKPVAGTIVGGIFLQKFVQSTPWVHLDIAGTAYGEEGALYAKGSTGIGVRLILEWLEQRFGGKK